uniref:Uncharacterized protein n=1 Tax=Arundo donax TaxID=35708 RepID=A0A0A9HXB7_ARUDO
MTTTHGTTVNNTETTASRTAQATKKPSISGPATVAASHGLTDAENGISLATTKSLNSWAWSCTSAKNQRQSICTTASRVAHRRKANPVSRLAPIAAPARRVNPRRRRRPCTCRPATDANTAPSAAECTAMYPRIASTCAEESSARRLMMAAASRLVRSSSRSSPPGGDAGFGGAVSLWTARKKGEAKAGSGCGIGTG